jgi:hypothetical protein
MVKLTYFGFASLVAVAGTEEIAASVALVSGVSNTIFSLFMWLILSFII